MTSFLCDYTDGAHPEVLKKLLETNGEKLPGYGEDRFCAEAKAKIAAFCGGNVQVHLLTGGTQTNMVVISALLRRHEAVVAAETGHISVHEAGAIEYTGHKVITLPAHDGRIDALELEAYMERFYSDGTHEHMCFPALVYISQPTELGTLYSKAQLEAISAVCRRFDLGLYIDGARLGYALASPANDAGIEDIVRLADVFYIGGTKLGAICGEAVVFTKNNMPPHFATLTKQQGAMLAKGRLLGVQFSALFTDGLYLRIADHAVKQAMKLKAAFLNKGYELFIDSPTNQQFVILTAEQLKRLSGSLAFSVWEPLPDGRTAVRFVTNWATTDEDIAQLEALI